MRKETAMKHITRQFSVLADCGKIYQFMLDITYSYKNRIWENNGKIVAFCFYENPMTDIYFSLKPGYEELALKIGKLGYAI